MRVLSHFLGFLLLASLLFGASHSSDAQVFRWADRFGAIDGQGYYDDPYDVVMAADSSLYVVGNVQNETAVFGTDTIQLPTTTFFHGFIAKYSPSGEILWVKIVEPASGFSIYNRPLEIEEDENGNIAVMVYTDENLKIDTLEYNNITDRSLLVLKFDPNGNLIWNKLFEGEVMNPVGMSVGENDDIFMAAVYNDSIKIDSAWITPDSGAVRGFVLVKMDSSGNVQDWSNSPIIGPVGVFTQLKKGDIDVNQDGDVLVVAAIDTAIIEGVQVPMRINGTSGASLIMKFNGDCSLQWVKQYYVSNGGQGTDNGSYITAFNDGGAFVVSTYSSFGTVFFEDSLVSPPSSSKLHFLMQLDSLGELTLFHILDQNVGNDNEYFDVVSNGDQIYIAGLAENDIKIGSFEYTMGSTDEAPVVIQYDATNAVFSVPIDIGLANGNARVRCADVDDFGNIAFGGAFSSTELHVDTHIISRADLYDGFVGTYYPCANLNISTISNQPLLCNGGQAELEANTPNENVNYQWFYGNSEISGATDSTYAALIPGQYAVRINDSVCAKTSDPITVSNGSPQTVSFNPPQDEFCSSDDPVSLSGGSPSGGQYAGTGVSNGVFDPQVAGGGTHFIHYIFTQSSGCVDTVSEPFQVSNAPSATFFQSFNTACTGDSIVLNSGLPVGGVYSGNGVVGNIFAPTLQDTGSQWLYYTRTNNGCSATDSIEVTVTASPQVTFNFPMDTTCEASSPIALTGQSPAGGTFSGTGVSGNFFIPQIVSPGEYAITYSITESGCTGSASDTIQVDSFPQVVLPALDSTCLSATNYALDNGYPAGGMYSGLGISNNIFDASVAGIGTHTVSYIYENACAADTAVSTITVIASPVLSATISDVSCNGLSDGEINTLINGGNAPYTFTWNTGDSTTQINNLVAGTYTLSATGEGGCMANNSFTVNEPAVLSAQIDSLNDVVCNGFADGEAHASTTGGTTPYNYLWSNNQVSSHATNLGAGTHQVLVTDANGCQDSVSVSINELDPIAISGSATDVSCADQTDGSINTSASGAGGSYNYAWSSGQSSNNLTNLDSGTYVLTVSDQNACTAEDTFVIAKPDSLLINLNPQNISCNGANDGYIAASTTGGTGTIYFLWSSASTSDSIGGLGAGSYTLTVSDANGCQTVESQTITEPDTISVNLSITQNLLCNGDANGAISSSASGGTSPYDYAWSTGGTAAGISGLSAGIYSMSITDANGCQKSASITLSEPAQLTIQIDSASDASCFGYNDGYVEASTSGGTGSINYAWSSGSTASSANDLVAGTYTVTATDDNGCTATATQSISEPAEITLAILSDDVNCFGENSGQATATAGNGQGSFTYTWSNAATTATADSLIAGSYTVTATDAAGCFVSDSVTIDQPTALSASFTLSQNLCHDDSTGSITSAVTGGTFAYAFAWTNGDTTSGISGVPAGVYTLTITDANGCELDSTFALNNPTQVLLNIDSTSNLLCFEDNTGYIATSANGGTGAFSFLWNDNFTSAARSGLPADTFSVTVSDANACTADTTLILTEPQELVLQTISIQHLDCFADTNGVIAVNTTGGTGSVDFVWNTNATSTQINNLIAGTYTVTATDDNGCIADTTVQLTQPDSIGTAISITNTHCDNTADGSIAITTSGGTSPYGFLWSTGATSDSVANLEPMSYGLTVTDANGCEGVRNIAVGFDFQSPQPALGADTGFCENDSLVLDPQLSNMNYSWNTSDTTQTITVNTPGEFTVLVTDQNGCFNSDTVQLEEYELPVFDLGNDTLFCRADLEEGFTITGPDSAINYTWSTGGTEQTETVTDFGIYFLTVESSEGCFYTDSIEVISDTCVGISGVHTNIEFTVYPNPNFGQFTLELSDATLADEVYTLLIFNAEGRLVLEQNMRTLRHSIDLSAHGAGVYYAHLISPTSLPCVKKVVVY